MKAPIKRSLSQEGMVSIIVTMIIMIVTSLVVLGFATLVRREQRQTLDRQLSAQAFYAAETGVNDAINKLNSGSPSDKEECATDPATFANPVLDASSNISYTCLLIDLSPTSLSYNSIATDKSIVVPIIAKAGTGPIDNITLNWQSADGGNGLNCPSLYQFPPNTNNLWPDTCNAGILRIDLVPNDGNLSRSSLLNNTLTAFLQPTNSNSSSFSYPAQGIVVGGSCAANGSPKLCNTIITGLTLDSYFLRVRSIYKSNSLVVTAKNSTGNDLELIGSQANIDSTGKANDVLKRISVNVSISGFSVGDIPDYAIQSSTTICKRFSAGPGFASVDATPGCEL